MVDFIHNRPGQRLTLLVERNGKLLKKTATPRWEITYLGTSWSFMEGKQAKVGTVRGHSAAEKAGIKEDDVLVSLNGRPITSGSQMVDAIKSAGKRVNLSLSRNGEPVTATANSSILWVDFAGAKWIFPGGYATPADSEIGPGSPAGKAGIKVDDQLIEIGSTKIDSPEKMLAYLASHKEMGLPLTVDRNGKPIKLILRAGASDYSSVQSGEFVSTGLLGFLALPHLERMGFTASIRRGLFDTWDYAVNLVLTIFSKRITKEIGGPVAIANMTNTYVALGPYWVTLMAGGLSLSLGFINLIPIPLVDGGHLLLIAIESVRRKRFSRRFMMGWQLAGFAIVAAIFATGLILGCFQVGRREVASVICSENLHAKSRSAAWKSGAGRR